MAMCVLAAVSISLSSKDPNTTMGPRHEARDARVAITSRDGSTMLLLMNDIVAVQLTNRALSDVESKKADTSFLEEILAAGVRVAVGKSVEYPIAHLSAVEYRAGALRILSDEKKPVFEELKVNGKDVLRDFSSADAMRFVNAFRNRATR